MTRTIPASCAIIAAFFVLCAPALAAPTGPIKATRTISAFRRPADKIDSLTVGGDGNAYGASSKEGYLVRVTPNGGFSVIHDFVGDAAGTPSALTLGKDGNLYGILSSNGSIFKSDFAGNITILATLGAASQPKTVFQAADGSLYGATFAGGSANHGSIFKVTATGQVSIIYSFVSGSFGPTELIETVPGVFYGVCLSSSTAQREVFKVTAEGVFTIANDFAGPTDSQVANLVFAGDGNIYGSYSPPDGQLTPNSIFRLTPAGDLTQVITFGGNHPISDVALGGDRNLYATILNGFLGTISRITLSGQVTLLHTFSSQDDGGAPTSIAAGPNQTLFGITSLGSINNLGTIYRVDAAGQFTTLVKLGAVGEGYSPNDLIFQANDGSFYGATVLGGSGGYGTIYRLMPSGERTTLHEFGADTGAPKFLVLGQDGRLYGACFGVSKQDNDGKDTLFRLETSGALTILHQFTDGDDGARVTGLVASQDGNIYGLTDVYHSRQYGSFFRVTPAGTFNLIRVFDSAASLHSIAGLVETKAGKLYSRGIAPNGEVLFQIGLDGATTVVHSFSPDGISGNGALIEGLDGNLYGTSAGLLITDSGGTHVVNKGGLWRCSPAGAFTILHTFDGADGLYLPTSLIYTANGDIYGLVDPFTVYRFTSGGVFEPLYRFDQIAKGLIQGTDGNLYGTTSSGGPLGGGTVFKFLFGNASAVNLASRMKVGTGNNVSIGGFIISGNGPKKVMLRGIGPSLSLAGKLGDPMLELHDASGAVIGRNDNWRTSQPGGVIPGDQSAEIKASGLAPADDREAALIASLLPGNYTAVVSGTQNTAGIGLVEIYDLDLEAGSNLGNLSTRGFADTGDNVLIGGFITNGSFYGRSKLIVRALGPSLAQFGIANQLDNPSLEIYDQNGNRQAANDDWQNGNQPEIASYGLAPSDPRESALYLVLAGGNYTALVTSSDGSMGLALIETYNLP